MRSHLYRTAGGPYTAVIFAVNTSAFKSIGMSCSRGVRRRGTSGGYRCLCGLAAVVTQAVAVANFPLSAGSMPLPNGSNRAAQTRGPARRDGRDVALAVSSFRDALPAPAPVFL